MSFETRQEFIEAQASEKITLAHVEGRARLYEWTLHAGTIWKKIVPYFVTELKQGSVYLGQVFSLGAVNAGGWFYDTITSTLYANFNGDVDPITIEAIVTYRFFYANGPVTASWDLSDLGKHVRYEGRIQSSPGFGHKVGIDQGLVSLVGSGTLKLENTDGGLDEIFDTILFENRPVTIYSWNRDLDFSSARVIYRGRITNKSYNSDSMSFTIKDAIFDLEQALPLEAYTLADGVNESTLGQYKRWIYGRVDGLKLQSIDQIGTGYQISGTASGIVQTNTINGTGTLFLSEVSPNDTLTINGLEFTVESIQSNTQLTVDEEIRFSFSGATISSVPEIPVTSKNREFIIAGHACAELTTTVVEVIQFNRVELASTDGLSAGDFLEFQNGERKEIKNLAPGNIVVLRDNLINIPVVSSTVKRQPVQRLYKESKQIEGDQFTITNLGAPTNVCKIELPSTIEFDLARAKTLAFDLAFTNGSRVVTTPTAVDLREFLKPRDWVRPQSLTYTTYYEVLQVNETSLDLRVAFADPTFSGPALGKLPSYIGDDTVISAEVIGKTETGEPSGTWLKTAPQIVKDILLEIGVSSGIINTATFDAAETDAPAVISLALPLENSSSSVKAKDAIDLINKSVFGSLTLDNDLKLQYRVLQMDVPENPTLVRDFELINWSIQTSNGKSFKDSVIRYRHKDVDRFTLESGTSLATFSSDFINNYIETNKLAELDAYIFDDNAAQIFAERYVYFNRLSRSDISLITDLRFENVEIGDVVQLEMRRLYKRFGDRETTKKLALVVGKTVTGSEVKLDCTDLGNLYNASAVIAPDTTNDYSLADTDEKLKWGFITDTEGIVDNNEDTANTNLIS
jgi:hypothetical protein